MRPYRHLKNKISPALTIATVASTAITIPAIVASDSCWDDAPSTFDVAPLDEMEVVEIIEDTRSPALLPATDEPLPDHVLELEDSAMILLKGTSVDEDDEQGSDDETDEVVGCDEDKMEAEDGRLLDEAGCEDEKECRDNIDVSCDDDDSVEDDDGVDEDEILEDECVHEVDEDDAVLEDEDGTAGCDALYEVTSTTEQPFSVVVHLTAATSPDRVNAKFPHQTSDADSIEL